MTDSLEMRPNYQISFSRFVDAQTQQNKKGIKQQADGRSSKKKRKNQKVFLLLRKMIAGYLIEWSSNDTSL